MPPPMLSKVPPGNGSRSELEGNSPGCPSDQHGGEGKGDGNMFEKPLTVPGRSLEDEESEIEISKWMLRLIIEAMDHQ